jgi:hypothetical protein
VNVLNPPDWYWPFIEVEIDWEDFPVSAQEELKLDDSCDVQSKIRNMQYYFDFSENARFDIAKQIQTILTPEIPATEYIGFVEKYRYRFVNRYTTAYMLKRQAKWLIDLKATIKDLLGSG